MIRFYWRYTFAFCLKQKLYIIASSLISIAIFFFFPKFLPYFKINHTQKIGIIGKYSSSTLPSDILQLISSGLTAINDDGSVKPGLASSWEKSSDNREYTFSLKPGIFWHDKKPITAFDINYNFNDVATSAIDNQTIKFTLKEPFPPFPIIVAKPIFKNGLIGTGNHAVNNIKFNGQIIEKLDLTGNLSFRFYPNEKTAKTAFQLGELDEIRGISNFDELEKWKNVKITPEINYHQFVAIFLDTQNPKFSSKSLRQALSYAIKDRWEPTALGPISPKSWAYNKDVKPYNYDLVNATTLLKKAVGDDNTAVNEIELSTIPSLLNTAESIKSDWAQLGIEVKIKVIRDFDQGFEALLISQDIPPDPDQYFLWHSTQSGNISHYKSPKVDKLLEEGRKTENQEKRKEIYFDFQKSLIEDSPAIFLYYPTTYNISRK